MQNEVILTCDNNFSHFKENLKVCKISYLTFVLITFIVCYIIIFFFFFILNLKFIVSGDEKITKYTSWASCGAPYVLYVGGKVSFFLFLNKKYIFFFIVLSYKFYIFYKEKNI